MKFIETVVRHVRGSRAVGGGEWYFNLCGGKNRKSKPSVFVAPAHTTCLRCQKIVSKIYGPATTEEDDKP